MRMDLPIQQILQQPTSHHLINPCIHFINAPKTRTQPTQPGKSIKYAAFLALAQSQSQLLAKRIHSKTRPAGFVRKFCQVSLLVVVWTLYPSSNSSLIHQDPKKPEPPVTQTGPAMKCWAKRTMRFMHLPNSPGPVDLSQFPDVEFMGRLADSKPDQNGRDLDLHGPIYTK